MAAGTLTKIHITTEESGPLGTVANALAVAGRGIEGDRYFGEPAGDGKYNSSDRAATLIEAEAIEGAIRDYGIELSSGETRRNLVTRGVALNHLVGRRFKVGQATLEGVELCEPCGHLEALTRKGVRKALVHRGGLRARIIEGGLMSVGDTVELLGEGQ